MIWSGFDVSLYAFVRLNRHEKKFPAHTRVYNLGSTVNGKYIKRILAVFRSIIRIYNLRGEDAKFDFIYARNPDLLVIAILFRYFRQKNEPIVYEIIDIQRVFWKQTPLGQLNRKIEGFLLKFVSAIVVSAPDFYHNYYKQMLDEKTPWVLYENKLQLEGSNLSDHPDSDREIENVIPMNLRNKNLTILVIGVFRCRFSIDLLNRVTKENPNKFKVNFYGFPDCMSINEFLSMIEKNDDMNYLGKFEHPRDLSKIYRSGHLNLCVDRSDKEGNSKYLLPNRIYDGSYFNCPAIAETNTAIGNMVSRLGIGYCFDEPFEENLKVFMDQITIDELNDKRVFMSQLDKKNFSGHFDFNLISQKIASQK